MGFPVEMFPVLFAIPRTAGWLAQWEEMLLDPEQKIARPRQIYIGPDAARLRADGVSGRWSEPARVSRTRRRVCVAARRLLLPAALRLPRAPRASTPAAAVRLAPRVGAPAAAGGDRPAAVRLAGHRADRATTSSTQLTAIGLTVAEQAVRRADAARHGADGESRRDHPRRAPGADRHRRPLRHEAVSRSSGSSAPTTADRAPRCCSSWRAC